MHAVTLGKIPLHKGRISDGAWLDGRSFGICRGRAFACWRHWKETDATFSLPAYWLIRGGVLGIIHMLDSNRSDEAAIIDRLREGEALYFSYGFHATPGQRQSYLLTYPPPEKPIRNPHALRGEAIGHFAYVPVGNFEQPPVKLIIGAAMIDQLLAAAG